MTAVTHPMSAGHSVDEQVRVPTRRSRTVVALARYVVLATMLVSSSGISAPPSQVPPVVDSETTPVEQMPAAPDPAATSTQTVVFDPAGPAPTPAYGSRIYFHGWSPNSRYIAYERTRLRPPAKRASRATPAEKPTVQRRHRRVEAGKMAGFGSANGDDVARYARENGYQVRPAGYASTESHKIYYDAAAGSLVVETSLRGDRVWWELRQGGKTITRRPFDQVYVDIEIDVYIAPDGRHGVLVMHLNAGYVVDAAIYAFKLRRRAPVMPTSRR